ncbi:Mut7-C ubiquitin/RNAse domain-containing protein [Candidatus Fermentibacterales bacterium]|nr:Mut7-C ubiquitin/RNAse domain-containing protein [Candidatus Fermentibacterales bacterium]
MRLAGALPGPEALRVRGLRGSVLGGEASFRFFGELNDFLPPDERQRPLLRSFRGRPSVKHMIEALGVPHTEIELITVSGTSVDFAYRVRDGDAVCVYPVFESFDVTPLLRLRETPLRTARFVVDTNLGKLALYLRILGFDTLYSNRYGDAEIAGISSERKRILLTRDRRLLHRRNVTHGYWVRSTDPREQIEEVARRFDLVGLIEPFHRCLRCNSELRPVDKSEVEHRLEPRTKKYYDEFRTCPDCGRIYWKGTHFEHMRQELLARLQGRGASDDPDRGC